MEMEFSNRGGKLIEELNKLTLQKLVASNQNIFKNLHESGKTKSMIDKGNETKRKNGFYKSDKWSKLQSTKGKKGGKSRSEQESFKEATELAIKNSLESRKIVRDNKYTHVLDSINKEEFSKKDIDDTVKILGYEKGINIRFMIKNLYIERCYEGTKGSKFDLPRYKRINS